MIALTASLARRYLWGKKGRSLITVLGIALGVTMVVAVALTNSAIIGSYENLLTAAAGRADLQLSAAGGGGFAPSMLADAARVEGVEAAVPVVSSGAPVLAGERKGSATFYGIDPALDQLVRTVRLDAGRLPAAAGEVALSREAAVGLKLTLGDSLQLLTTRGWATFELVGLFDSGGTVRGSLGPFGLLTLDAAQAAFGREGRLDLVDLILAPGASEAAVRQRLAERLGPSVRVATPAERTEDMNRLLDGITFVLSLGGSISILAGAFIIFTNVAISVAERRRELSILRALGLRRGEAVRLVLAEVALLGLTGSLLGILWGLGLATGMAQQMTDQFLKSYHLQLATVTMTPSVAATGLLVGVGISLLAALLPAWETVRVSPVEAMRPGDSGPAEGGWSRGRRLGLAALLIAGSLALIGLTWPGQQMIAGWILRLWGVLMGAILLGVVIALPALLPAMHRLVLKPLLGRSLGIFGRLAADNLLRRPARTTATVAALTISLAFMVGIGGVSASQTAAFDRWYNEAVGWDLNVSSSFVGLAAQVEMDDAFVHALRGVEGVRLVSPQKMHPVLLADGKQAFLQVFDHAILGQYSRLPLEQGDWERVLRQMTAGGGAIISPAVAYRLGVGVGDLLAIPTPAGEQPFRVRAVMLDITPYGGTIQIDRQDYLRYWGDTTSTNIALLITPGTDPALVREQIMARWGEQMNLTVRLNREFWAEIKAQYDAFYKLMDGLIWISVLVSGLAIANTLFASVLERRREVGMLRAVGTRRAEVLRLISGEALATGLVGGLLGVAAGFGLQVMMVATSERINGAAMQWTIDGAAVAMALGVALLFAPLVGLLPARWAAQLDVVDALRYE